MLLLLILFKAKHQQKKEVALSVAIARALAWG